MVNEGVYRSPKWMRNFADFEINTDDDIKGQPSKRRQKQIDKEEKRKEEKRKEDQRRGRERIKKDEERIKQERKRKHNEKFNVLLEQVMGYIYSNYKNCEMEVPKEQYFKISKDNLSYRGDELTFEVTLNNIPSKPEFKVNIILGKEIYNYTISGLFYGELKMFIIGEVYPHFKSNYSKYSKKKSDKYKSYQDGGEPEEEDWPEDETYEEYKKKSNYKKKSTGNYRKKSPPKNEKDPDKNRLRRYNLLKTTLEGYKRQMDEIRRWEKSNKKHHSDRITVENEIYAVERRIEEMKKEYSFEKLNHDFIELNLVEIGNRINIIKNDLGMK